MKSIFSPFFNQSPEKSAKKESISLSRRKATLTLTLQGAMKSINTTKGKLP
jgi:hypothetical protein